MQQMSNVMTYVTVLWLRSEQNIVWNELALIKRMHYCAICLKRGYENYPFFEILMVHLLCK